MSAYENVKVQSLFGSKNGVSNKVAVSRASTVTGFCMKGTAQPLETPAASHASFARVAQDRVIVMLALKRDPACRITQTSDVYVTRSSPFQRLRLPFRPFMQKPVIFSSGSLS
ncbi:hypothetical protein ACROYT_G036242 [Oculina patagonica]